MWAMRRKTVPGTMRTGHINRTASHPHASLSFNPSDIQEIQLTRASPARDNFCINPSMIQPSCRRTTAMRSSGDAEIQDAKDTPPLAKKTSAFKSLGWLDRFLALWILLAMVLGVLLGNFVPDVGPALQKGKFADVSIPIGMPCPRFYFVISADNCCSCRAACDDVSDPLQSAV